MDKTKASVSTAVLATVFAAGHFTASTPDTEPRVVTVNMVQRTIALVDSDAGVQTLGFVDGSPTGLYYDFAALIPAFRPDAERVLVLGVGGCEMCKVLRRSGYRGDLVGVDSASDSKAVAKKFGLDTIGLELHVADALGFVGPTTRQFEGIIVDLYAGPKMSDEQANPVLYSRLVKYQLAPRGVVLVNVAHRPDVERVAAAMRGGGLAEVYAFKVGKGAKANNVLLGVVKDDWESVSVPPTLADAINYRWIP